MVLVKVLQHLGQEHLPFEHPDVVHYENEMGYEMKLLWAEVTWQKQVLQQSMDIFFPMERMWQVVHWEATKLQWVFLNISFTDFFFFYISIFWKMQIFTFFRDIESLYLKKSFIIIFFQRFNFIPPSPSPMKATPMSSLKKSTAKNSRPLRSAKKIPFLM